MSFRFTLPLFALCCLAAAQSLPPVPRVFISSMEGNLDGFIAAEIIKQHLPVKVVTDEKEAQLILTGLSIKEDDKWYNIAFNRFKDKNEGNVRLIDVQNKTMVWAGEAGDRSLIFGGFRRGGQRKVAERVASKMKKEFFGGRQIVGGTVTTAQRGALKSLLWPAGD